MPDTIPLTHRDQIIADAKSLPDLIARAQVFDPKLATALTGQATLASKTPLGAFVSAGVAWVASRYGLGWDPNTDALVAGMAVLAGGYVTHWVQARFASLHPSP